MIEALFAIALAVAVPIGVLVAAGLLFGESPVDGRLRLLVLAAVGAALIGLALGRGPLSALLAAPWVLVTIAVAISAAGTVLRDIVARRRSAEPWRLGVAIACGFLAVGAVWLVLDRAAFQPFGFDRTVVLLTAVHFHVAGFVLTLAGCLAARRRPVPAMHVVVAALVVGTPLTALGFFGFPIVSWFGAILVAVGGIGIGLATISISRAIDIPIARAALLIGGVTLFLTMPIAIAYATGVAFAVAFLDIPAMAAIHGGLNVLGFAIPAMVGWQRVVWVRAGTELR
jgi:hypothetical protein